MYRLSQEKNKRNQHWALQATQMLPMPTSHMSTSFSPGCFPSNPVSCSRAWKGSTSNWAHHPCEKPMWHSWLLASTWHTPSHCSHLGSKPDKSSFRSRGPHPPDGRKMNVPSGIKLMEQQHTMTGSESSSTNKKIINSALTGKSMSTWPLPCSHNGPLVQCVQAKLLNWL